MCICVCFYFKLPILATPKPNSSDQTSIVICHRKNLFVKKGGLTNFRLVIFSPFFSQNEIKALSEERTAIKEQLDSSNSTIAILQNEKNNLEVDITDSKKEQDDLLVLLADQDQKIFSLKNKLKELGHPVTLKCFQK